MKVNFLFIVFLSLSFASCNPEVPRKFLQFEPIKFENVSKGQVHLQNNEKVVLNDFLPNYGSGEILFNTIEVSDEDHFFFLEIINKNKNIRTKFIQIPHHPAKIDDDGATNLPAIGILEVIDLGRDKDELYVHYERNKNDVKKYSINIPKDQSETEVFIMVHFPQQVGHTGYPIHPNTHKTGHKVIDPRGS